MNKVAPKVERRTFDPRNPPKDLPTLKHNELAITEYQFQIQLDVAFAPGLVDKAPDGRTRAAMTIHNVNVRLALPIKIWNPNNADEHLKAHEEGHRVLAETFYKDAEKVARALAQDLVGRRIEGVGKDKNAAIGAALQKVSQEMSEKYLAGVMGPCDETQKIYEEITQHSQNRDIASDKAVQQALERWRESKKKSSKP